MVQLHEIAMLMAATKKEKPPTEFPQNFRFVSATQRSATWQWDLLDGATSYDCEGRRNFSGQATFFDNGNTDNRCGFISLERNSFYQARVRARNNAGPGPWSNWVTGQTLS